METLEEGILTLYALGFAPQGDPLERLEPGTPAHRRAVPYLMPLEVRWTPRHREARPVWVSRRDARYALVRQGARYWVELDLETRYRQPVEALERLPDPAALEGLPLARHLEAVGVFLSRARLDRALGRGALERRAS